MFPIKNVAHTLLSLTLGASGVAMAQPRSAPFDFQGRFLVSVSDADMVPSAYIDGKLGPADGADALSVIRLDRPNRAMRAVETPVSNSVTGPPACLAVSPDGKTAIVVETRGPRPAKANPLLADLATGRAISVVDLSDPDRPRVTQRIQSFEKPVSVSINAGGSLVAVSFAPDGAGKATPLAIYRLSGGRLSAPITPKIPNWAAGDSLRDVQWHPRENVLALLNDSKLALSFVRVADAGGQISLSAWGEAVAIEKSPYRVCWTPNGRFAVVNAMDANAVLAVRLGEPHQIVSRAETGGGPEGLCISPDGRWVVTTNIEHSFEPAGNPKQSFFSSLTLARLDSETGVLDGAKTFAFDGMLPESAAFDNSSRFLAVTNFSHFDPSRKGGSIDFWRLAGDDERRELVKMDFSVPVTRGPQTMAIVR